MKFRQMLLSLLALGLVIGGLAYVDPRVRDQFAQIVSGGNGISSWDDQFVSVTSTLVSALRYQSLENGPLLIFAVVGAVLFLFMVRT